MKSMLLSVAILLSAGVFASEAEISKQKAPETFSENVEVARTGGKVAGDARRAIEAQTGIPVITSKTAAQLNQVVTHLIEGIAVEGNEAE